MKCMGRSAPKFTIHWSFKFIGLSGTLTGVFFDRSSGLSAGSANAKGKIFFYPELVQVTCGSLRNLLKKTQCHFQKYCTLPSQSISTCFTLHCTKLYFISFFQEFSIHLLVYTLTKLPDSFLLFVHTFRLGSVFHSVQIARLYLGFKYLNIYNGQFVWLIKYSGIWGGQ